MGRRARAIAMRMLGSRAVFAGIAGVSALLTLAVIPASTLLWGVILGLGISAYGHAWWLQGRIDERERQENAAFWASRRLP